LWYDSSTGKTYIYYDSYWVEIGASSTLPDGSVTSAKIANDTITNADISSTAAIAYSKLNLANSITSSDIASETIVDADISTTAAIAKTKISGTAITAADAGTITSTMIADGTIVNGDINATAAIAYSKLNLANSIVTNDLANSSVSTAKIIDNAITQSKFDTSVPISGFRNKIINGNMVIAQRGTAAVTGSGTKQFAIDRWMVFNGTGTVTFQQSSTAPAGFSNSLLATVTATGSYGTTGYTQIGQFIEGYNVADLALGTASAKTFTVSFWCRSSVTGTYNITIQNGSQNRSYITTFTILSANTWEYKTITITGDTTGSWAVDNTAGMTLWINLGVGSNFDTTANTWTAGSLYSTSAAVDFAANAGATFYLTGVQIEQSTQATPFEQRPYGVELQLCQRYYQRHDLGGSYFMIAAPVGSGNGLIQYSFPVPMRAAPTLTASSGSCLRPLTTGGSSVGTTNTTSVGWYSTANQYGGQIYFSGSSGLTAGAAVGVYVNSGAYFEFTGAEL
jgi:hypothetical protein